MENSNCRHRSNPVTPKLRELVACAAVDIHKTVHVGDTETLDMGLGIQLPLGTEAADG
jgi:hypothetical protein